METILIVDDEKNYLVVLEALLGPEGYEILTAGTAREALRQVREAEVDLIITDMKMPGMSGMELLEEVKKIDPYLPLIMMTAYGTIEMAVEAMKKQAFDYITKPFRNEELKLTVKKALENHRLLRENQRLNDELLSRHRFDNIIGKSKPMQAIFDLVGKVSKTRASVLITGSSGTGKELIAKAIHYNSPRSNRPFVSINCGALTETLLESELFGHEKGAFTGAAAMKKGRFEVADGGTLFLDEVGEMPPSLQVKLLRVLQEMEFERVGGTRTIKVDVRVLSASNRNINEDVANDLFREDLFYRLNVMHIKVPSLKERVEDIPLLVKHFIDKYVEEEERDKIQLSQEAWKALYEYSWPGNVRELENVIERALILKSGHTIGAKELPEHLLEPRDTGEGIDLNNLVPPDMPLPEAVEKIEEKLIQRALEYCDNVQSKAAAMLGISRRVMHYKMNKYGLGT